MSQMPQASGYPDQEEVARVAASGHHRQLIGDMWDEIGLLQFEFLRNHGLKPHHKLIDIGCGCLRGGVHFVRYLNPENYFGIDINQPLLDAGYEIELARIGLTDRLPRSNLICNREFDLDGLGVQFDFALAQSLFTHLPFNDIRQCLERAARVVKPGGVFYATFFELPDGISMDAPMRHEPGGVVTYGARDPFHYRVRDLEHAALGLPWIVRYVGDWKHPRGQHLLAFVR